MGYLSLDKENILRKEFPEQMNQEFEHEWAKYDEETHSDESLGIWQLSKLLQSIFKQMDDVSQWIKVPKSIWQEIYEYMKANPSIKVTQADFERNPSDILTINHLFHSDFLRKFFIHGLEEIRSENTENLVPFKLSDGDYGIALHSEEWERISLCFDFSNVYGINVSGFFANIPYIAVKDLLSPTFDLSQPDEWDLGARELIKYMLVFMYGEHSMPQKKMLQFDINAIIGTSTYCGEMVCGKGLNNGYDVNYWNPGIKTDNEFKQRAQHIENDTKTKAIFTQLTSENGTELSEKDLCYANKYCQIQVRVTVKSTDTESPICEDNYRPGFDQSVALNDGDCTLCLPQRCDPRTGCGGVHLSQRCLVPKETMKHTLDRINRAVLLSGSLNKYMVLTRDSFTEVRDNFLKKYPSGVMKVNDVVNGFFDYWKVDTDLSVIKDELIISHDVWVDINDLQGCEFADVLDNKTLYNLNNSYLLHANSTANLRLLCEHGANSSNHQSLLCADDDNFEDHDDCFDSIITDNVKTENEMSLVGDIDDYNIPSYGEGYDYNDSGEDEFMNDKSEEVDADQDEDETEVMEVDESNVYHKIDDRY